jgi:hypothetical protein
MATESDTEGAKTKDVELRPEVFDDYDAFLKQAIRDFYDRAGRAGGGASSRS